MTADQTPPAAAADSHSGPSRLAEIEARAKAATPGLWKVDDHTDDFDCDDKEWCGELTVLEGCNEDDCEGHVPVTCEYAFIEGPAFNEFGEGNYFTRADAAFVAHAREDIPYLVAALQEARDQVERLTREKDLAYSERDKAVAGFAHMARRSGVRVGVGQHEGADWEDDWRTVLFVELPAGQVSWHFHDSERPLLDGLPVAPDYRWDGHTTEEKWARVASLADASLPPADAPLTGVALMEAVYARPSAPSLPTLEQEDY